MFGVVVRGDERWWRRWSDFIDTARVGIVAAARVRGGKNAAIRHARGRADVVVEGYEV